MKESEVTIIAGVIIFAVLIGLYYLACVWLTGSVSWPVDLFRDSSSSWLWPVPIFARIINLVVVVALAVLVIEVTNDELSEQKKS